MVQQVRLQCRQVLVLPVPVRVPVQHCWNYLGRMRLPELRRQRLSQCRQVVVPVGRQSDLLMRGRVVHAGGDQFVPFLIG